MHIQIPVSPAWTYTPFEDRSANTFLYYGWKKSREGGPAEFLLPLPPCHWVCCRFFGGKKDLSQCKAGYRGPWHNIFSPHVELVPLRLFRGGSGRALIGQMQRCVSSEGASTSWTVTVIWPQFWEWEGLRTERIDMVNDALYNQYI